MKNTTLICIYIIFIICIILIAIYYNNNTPNTPNKIIETFDELSVNPTTDTISQPQLLLQRLRPDVIAPITSINIESLISNILITDKTQKKIVIDYLQTLYTNLGQYANLSIPININNNGTMCKPWNTYNNSAYINNSNNCINLDTSTITYTSDTSDPPADTYQCLSRDDILTSCNKLYDTLDIYGNKIIDSNKIINIASILINTTQNIVSKINNIISNITNKKNVLEALLNNIITKSKFEKQQKNFIIYNENNTKQKQHNNDNIANDINDTQNDINIKKLNLNNFASSSVKNDNKLNLYYKCIKYLLIILVVVIILNIISSKIL